jgi:hypothetical protein
MGVDGQRQVPAALPPQKRPSNHCTGGWLGPRAGLDGCGKFHPPPGFDPRNVQPVASRYRLRYLGPPVFNICFNFERPCILLTRCRYRLYWYCSYDVQKSSCNFNKILTMECDNTCLVTVNLEGISKCSVSKISFLRWHIPVVLTQISHTQILCMTDLRQHISKQNQFVGLKCIAIHYVLQTLIWILVFESFLSCHSIADVRTVY